MDDDSFLEEVRSKIERLTGQRVELALDAEHELDIGVDWSQDPPRVILSEAILAYPGLARMGIEYAVACLRAGHLIDVEEFEVILRRN
jgi:hypothetical protein